MSSARSYTNNIAEYLYGKQRAKNKIIFGEYGGGCPSGLNSVAGGGQAV